MSNPKRGEIWLVQLDPTRGQEIPKTRPAVVISSEIFSSIPMRIIIPVATWQPKSQIRPFMIPILPTNEKVQKPIYLNPDECREIAKNSSDA